MEKKILISPDCRRGGFGASLPFFPSAPRGFLSFVLGGLFFLSALLPAFGASARDADNGGPAVISSLRIRGLEDISLGTVKKSMLTPFPSKKPWKKDPEFDRQLLEDDIKRIEQLMRDHGYYASSVTRDIVFGDGGSRVDIEITVDQGDPVTLNALEVKVLADWPDDYAAALRKAIPLRKGRRFSQIKYQESKAVIAEMLSEKGYVLAEVKSEAIVNLRRKGVAVEFVIAPGRRYSFGEATFSGNSNIASGLLEREIEHEKGEVFSPRKTQKSRSNIFKTGFFSSVIVDLDYDTEALEIDTRYSVTESKLGTVKLGAGYATEDRFRAKLTWTQKNFLGGGRILRVTSSYSSLTRGVWTKLDQPHVIGRNSNLSFLIDVKRDDFPGYEGVSYDFNSTLSKEFWDDFTVFGSAVLIYADIDSQVVRTPAERARDNVYMTLAALGLEYDGTNSFINPTRGFRVFLSLEKPFQIASSSNTDYLKSLAEFRYYRDVFGFVLGKRFTVGNINTFGSTDPLDVPIFKRFFAGGSTSMRGYSFQQLGPLNPSRDPLGGNSMIVGNVEVRLPPLKKLGAVTFVDYGNVYPESFGFSPGDIKYAAGAGLRYHTAIGPVRLDFGYLLNPAEEERDRRLRIFVSIGQAF